MDRWERRARKLEARNRRMQVTGRGIITVTLPTILKKALEARAEKAASPQLNRKSKKRRK